MVSLLEFLHQHFQLTGSRFMSAKNPTLISVSPDTDWDFVACEGDPHIAEFEQMVNEGRQSKTESDPPLEAKRSPDYLGDTSTIRVVKSEDERYQLIIKSSSKFSAYCTIFNSMTPEFYSKRIWKSSPEMRNIPFRERRVLIQRDLDVLLDFFN